MAGSKDRAPGPPQPQTVGRLGLGLIVRMIGGCCQSATNRAQTPDMSPCQLAGTRADGDWANQPPISHHFYFPILSTGFLARPHKGYQKEDRALLAYLREANTLNNLLEF